MEKIHKLFTKEDSFYIHKTLGVICLCNFIYQFCHCLVYNKMQLQNIIFIHGLLNLTSFIFKISNLRNYKLPIIYKEFRFHSFIFAFRSVLCSLIFFTPYKNILYRIAICYLTMIFADIATFYYKDKTTIRDVPMPENMTLEEKQNLILHYSKSQVGATLYMLGNIETSFAPLLPIQLAAFLMTLCKKSLITTQQYHLGYTISLWIASLAYLSTKPSFLVLQFICGRLFIYLRFKQNINKYVSWFIVFSCFIFFEEKSQILDQYIGIYFIQVMIFKHIVGNIFTHRKLWS